MKIRCLFLLTILAAIVGSLKPLEAFAQQNPPPKLEIVRVDSTQFPAMTLTLQTANLPEQSQPLALQLFVDGKEHPIVADQKEAGAIQFAVVIDPTNLSAIGYSDAKRNEEMVIALRSLIESSTLQRNQDWLAAFSLTADDTVQTIQDWTQEPNLIYNNVAQNPLSEIVGGALPTNGLLRLLAQFQEPHAPYVTNKSVLLFSAGAESVNIEQVIETAHALSIQIHVIELLGQGQQPAADTPLAQLAIQTQGQYLALTTFDDLPAFWPQLAQRQPQRLITFQTAGASPQTLEVRSTLPDGALLSDTVGQAEIGVLTPSQPPQVRIVAPLAGSSVEWVTLAPANGEAKALPVQVEVVWPDNQPGTLTAVDYELHGPNGLHRQLTRTEEPFRQAVFELDNTVQTGDYTIAVVIVDAAGLTSSNSAAITLLGPPANSNTQTSAEKPVTAEAAANAVASTTVQLPTESSATVVEPVASTVKIPGAPIFVPRALLMIALPILLALIGYFVYADIRDRRSRSSGGQRRGRYANSGPIQDPLYALDENSQRLPAQEFKLNPERAEASEDEPVEAVPFTPSPRRGATPAVARSAPQRSALVHPDDDDELTVQPAPRMDDEEATYRLNQEVQQPRVGYLMRVTSDPNLPKELPVYGLPPGLSGIRQIHIGRHSKNNTVVINDKSISREHAVIIQKEGRLYLRDNASAAGTFLNWKRLKPGEELLLRHNDLISFGEIVYEFRAHGEDEATVSNEQG